MQTADRIWIWFADNGNIRKWSSEPFDEGIEYRRPSDMEGVEAEPVAWRWKPKDSTTWIYDPDTLWLAHQSSDDIDKEPVYSAASLSALSAELEQVREALKPFAAAVSTYENDFPNANTECLVKFSALLAARAALAAALPLIPREGVVEERETIQSMIAWGDETFGPCTAERAQSRAAEEWREMASEVPGTPQHAVEAADVIICLLRIPGIQDALNGKMAKNRARKWRLMGDGTGYHIKGAPALRSGGDNG